MDPNEVILLNKITYMKEPPLVTNFTHLCRLCMRLITNIKTPRGAPSLTIHDEYYKLSVKSLVETYTFVKLPDADDKLPKRICLECADFLIAMHAFRSKCHLHNDLLTKLAKEHENSIKELQYIHNYASVNLNSGPSTSQECHEDEEHVELEPEIPPPLVPEHVPLQPFELMSLRITDQKFGVHRCIDCPEVFNNRKALWRHRVQAKHPKNTKQACPVCEKKMNARALSQHMLVHTHEKPYVCPLCPFRSASGGNLRRHLRIHTGEKPFACDVCGKAFNQLNTLRTHEKVHTRVKLPTDATIKPKKTEVTSSNRSVRHYGPLVVNGKQTQITLCNFCRLGFVDGASYQQHMDAIHIVPEPENKENNKSLLQTLLQPPDKMYACTETKCHAVFLTEGFLLEHMKRHKGKLLYGCSLCEKQFAHRLSLINHMAMHTGVKLYDCSTCKKSFTTAMGLMLHAQIHTGARRYACRVCSRPFRQQTHLTYHMRTHSGERPYVCQFCGRTFALNGNLTVHKRIHTGEAPYKCQACHKGFRNSSSRKKHLASKHSAWVLQTAMDVMTGKCEFVGDEDEEEDLYSGQGQEGGEYHLRIEENEQHAEESDPVRYLVVDYEAESIIKPFWDSDFNQK